MPKKFNDGRDWFFEKRFGMFIHWGLYAIPAWHEQHPYRKPFPRDEYVKFMDQFNPVDFNPEKWLDKLQESGMKYLCFTTKHVDGFCMWNTAQTDYNVMNTPYGRDILKMISDACHRRDIPLCLYYSLADMHHPNYPSYGNAYERPEKEAGDEPDMDKYLAFVEAQIKELCTNYGKIHGFWWDANMIEYNSPRLNDLIHSMQPDAVINCRGGDPGDFDNAEREWNTEIESMTQFKRPIEGCQSIGHESWGWKTDEDYYSIRYMTLLIDKIMARGGNYLVNVGPDASGRFPEKANQMLEKIGKWYEKVKESFINTVPAPEYSDGPDVLISKKENVLYAHLLNPECNRLLLPLIGKTPLESILLNNSQKLEAVVDKTPRRFKEKNDCLRVRGLPVDEISNETLVVKIVFDSLPEPQEGTSIREEG